MNNNKQCTWAWQLPTATNNIHDSPSTSSSPLRESRFFASRHRMWWVPVSVGERLMPRQRPNHVLIHVDVCTALWVDMSFIRVRLDTSTSTSSSSRWASALEVICLWNFMISNLQLRVFPCSLGLFEEPTKVCTFTIQS